MATYSLAAAFGASRAQISQIVNSYPLLDIEDERRLAHRMINDCCAESRDKIVLSNLRLVLAIMKKMKVSDAYFEDAFQQGVVGLLAATEKFELQNEKFGSFAFKYVLGEISNFVYGAVRLSDGIKFTSSNNAKKARAHFRGLAAKYQYEDDSSPKISQRFYTWAAAQIGVSEDLIKEIDDMRKIIVEIDAEADEMHSILVSNTQTPEEAIISSSSETPTKVLAALLMSVLDPRRRGIIRQRIANDDGKPPSCRKLGETLGISGDRVRQLQEDSLLKLAEAAQSLFEKYGFDHSDVINCPEPRAVTPARLPRPLSQPAVRAR